VVKRVTDAVSDRSRPRVELLPVVSIACHEALVDPVRTHCAPLIVIACEPRVREIAKSRVFENERGIEVAMEVEYRHFGSMIVEKPLRRLVSKQKIVRNELHFFNYSPFICIIRITQENIAVNRAETGGREKKPRLSTAAIS
jgi:hypothetical protein